MSFGKSPSSTPHGASGHDDVSLRGRGERLRRLGEIIVLAGLAILLLWEDAVKIAPTIANFRSFIHIPFELVSFFHPDEAILRHSGLPWPGDMRNASTVVELIILLSALSAVVRKRLMAMLGHLAFFLFPWPLLGIDIGIAQFCALGILAAMMVHAARKSDRRQIAVLGACIMATFVWYEGIHLVKQADTDQVYIALPRNPDTHIVDTLTGSADRTRQLENLPPAVLAGLAYVGAQEAVLRDKPDVALERLTQAERYSWDHSSTEAHRLRAIGLYLATKKIGTDDRIVENNRLGYATILKTRILLATAALALVGGIILQTLSGWIGKRAARMDELTGQLQSHGPPAGDMRPPPADSQNASLGFTADVLADLKHRTWTTLLTGIGLLALAAALHVISRLFWVPDINSNTAFATIHVLEDFASLNSAVLSHETWLRMQGHQSSLWMIALPTCAFFTGLCLLVLRRYRMLVFSIAAYCAWTLYGLLAPTAAGMVELPASALNLTAIPVANASSARSQTAEIDRKVQDSTNYVLAQAAYLRNDLAETERRLSPLIDSGYRKMNAFEWRFAAMSDWVSQKRGIAMIDSRLRPNLVLFQTVSTVSGMAALAVGPIAVFILIVSAVLALRLRRLGDFVAEISIGSALQRTRHLR